MKSMYPDIPRPDSEVSLLSKWRVENPKHQKKAGDAAIDVWEKISWPEGLISHTAFLGHDKLPFFSIHNGAVRRR